ncbi:hypothetical protein JW964_25010 [candidate division KSB1 bacterium]|nr:hypothetical protein [candidate division KSB1 bacterium]
MFELPEYIILSRQINETIQRKVVKKGLLGNSPHKFVWYNRTHEEFERLTEGTTVGKAFCKGRWMFIPLLSDYVLVLGECGGKILYHQPGTLLPKKYHLWLTFTDDSAFSVTTQMWGAMELYEKGKEFEGNYVKNMKITPIDPGFTFDYFCKLIDAVLLTEKKSVKGLLTQDQLIPGLGNSITQDIMFTARLHPRHPIDELDMNERQTLYHAIQETLQVIIKNGGRYDEFDLFGNPGKYVRIMDKIAVGKPCSGCGGIVEKMQYLGGTCYFCPACQK